MMEKHATAKKFLKELLDCQECKQKDNGKTWIFCKKHWKQLKEFGDPV